MGEETQNILKMQSFKKKSVISRKPLYMTSNTEGMQTQTQTIITSKMLG